MSVSFYGGDSGVSRSDVIIRQAGGTDITLRRIAWDTKSFETPLYCGMRILFWLPRLPEAGFGIDYTHAKAFADDAQVVEVSGTRAGAEVRGWEPVGNTVRSLGFSHGLNFFMLNMHRRWFPKNRFQPYVGLGMGVVLPHTEGKIGTTNGDGYRYGGLAYQVLGGIGFRVAGPISIFGEYKLQYARVDVPYDWDTQVTANFWMRQALAGLSIGF